MPDIERITSRDNQRLILARKVRDGKDATRIFIEGKRLVAEAVRSGLAVEECFVTDAMAEDELVRRCNAPTASLSEKLFRSIADTENSQGVIVIASRPTNSLAEIDLKSSQLPIVVFLSRINNPSNLGAVVRTAEAAGAAGVILSPRSADAFSPKALRATMGSAFRIPIVEGVDLRSAAEWSSQNGLRSIAADGNANDSHTKVNWKDPHLLVFGSEAHGLNDDELALVDEKVRIPIADTVESLNLAVSAGVLLFEAKRQNEG